MPPYEVDPQGQRRNYNQRSNIPYNPNTTSTSRDIVPAQNNMASDYDWCYPCNQPHNQTTCLNGMLHQALMVQNNVVISEDNTCGTDDQQVSHSEQGSDVTLVNWQGEEFCGVNQPQDQN